MKPQTWRCSSTLSLLTVVLALSGCGWDTGGSPNADSSTSTVAVTNLTQDIGDIEVTPVSDSVSNDPVPAPSANYAQFSAWSPAQIRQAYGLDPVPSSLNGLSSAQRAALGAGQTIYIIVAYHNPNLSTELDRFNTTFSLPPCTYQTLTDSTPLPLDSASASDGCKVLVAPSNAAGEIASSVPMPDSTNASSSTLASWASWALEATIDVQWAHATAPLARIVVVEAAKATVSNLAGAVTLANAMGPGVVSMSFGTPEGSWTSTVDSVFGGDGKVANMTYVAAAGDKPAVVQWPSVSPNVLAVGGTSLQQFTTGANASRTETTWSGSSGGVSQYTPAPDYQTTYSVPGIAVTPGFRNVPDVAFNANPTTGQYTAFKGIAAGATLGWYRVGGTSMAAPQWAGLLAVANAQRSANNLGPLGSVQNALYAASSQPGFFASLSGAVNYVKAVFNDILGQSPASSGYSAYTGLGSPNGNNVLTLLATGQYSAQLATTAPIVGSLAVTGVESMPLSFTLAHNASNPVAWSLSGAPSGMSINSNSGLITWSSPPVGRYTVTVSATDTVTGDSGTGTVTLTISPILSAAGSVFNLNAEAGVAFEHLMQVRANSRLTWAMAGTGGATVPDGLSLDSQGKLTWANPVHGSYPLTVTATDIDGDSVSLNITLAVSDMPLGPRITVVSPVTGVAGRPLSTSIGISDPGARRVTVTFSGKPAGMTFVAVGGNIIARWPWPVAGTYDVVITAKDEANNIAQKTMTVVIPSP